MVWSSLSTLILKGLKTKKVPHDNSYKIAKKFDNILLQILVGSAVLSTIFIALNFLKFEFVDENVFFFINAFIALIAVVYFVLEFFKEEMFQKAEIERKQDFIDNSLNTRLSLQNSSGYYSNDSIDPSVFKLGVNCFENTYFTYKVSKKMLPVAVIKFLFVLVLFVFVALFSGNQLLLLMFQVPLPYVLLKDSYRTYRLNQNVCEVLEKFQIIFSNDNSNSLNELIINNVISYEKVLSTYSILLNSKLFGKMNDDLSKEWKELKIKYNIF